MSVEEHQRRTVFNYLDLKEIAPDLPFVPVIQGYEMDDYMRCVDLYGKCGVDLPSLPLVGLGSVCRRQATGEIEEIVRVLHSYGIRLHGFGVKLEGLGRTKDVLESADSMAWSFSARRSPPLPGCRHKNCANCMRYALMWRDRVLEVVSRPKQYRLF